MMTSLDSFPCANIVVGGPPCPPFSSCGRRLAMQDSRVRPFKRCIEVICELDHRRRKGQATRELCFFVLENVPGICFKPNQDNPSALDTLLATLRERLKERWLISAIRVNTLNYGLPQNRDRVYIIGRRASLYQLHLPREPPVFARQVKPRELLRTEDTEPGHLTSLQAHLLGQDEDPLQGGHGQRGQPGQLRVRGGRAGPHWADSLGRSVGACRPLPVSSSSWAIHPGVCFGRGYMQIAPRPPFAPS